jgi:hypothetical protein
MNMPETIVNGGAGKGHWAAKQKVIDAGETSKTKGDHKEGKKSNVFDLLKSQESPEVAKK